jgi:hypothetical protein
MARKQNIIGQDENMIILNHKNSCRLKGIRNMERQSVSIEGFWRGVIDVAQSCCLPQIFNALKSPSPESSADKNSISR